MGGVCAKIFNTSSNPAFYNSASGKRNATSLANKGIGTVLGYGVSDKVNLVDSEGNTVEIKDNLNFMSAYFVPETFEYYANLGFHGYLGLGIYAPPAFFT